MILEHVMLGALYLLGAALMIDNIRAQPHEDEGRRGYGWILLLIVACWPLVMAWNLLPRRRT